MGRAGGMMTHAGFDDYSKGNFGEAVYQQPQHRIT